LHLVHVDHITKRAGAVIAILFDVMEDVHNPFFDHTGEVDLESFIETVDFRHFYFYEGSFTTPPCTDGIDWFVVT
jgi:carbonic anhydrase